MNQVGDLKTFRVAGSPPTYPDPTYVWKFWDGAVIATGTASGSVQKRLNLGGNPAEGGGPPYVIPFRCDICDQLGNVVQTLTDKIAVNNPPTIVGAPSVTPNNQAFPFTPEIDISAYDLENNMTPSAGVVGFFWYQGTVPVSNATNNITSGPVNVAGTYYGTLIGSNRDLYTNKFSPTVYGAGTTYTCKIVDADSGTRSINVPVQGFDPSAPLFSLAAQPNTLTTDASNLPTQFIAPGQSVTFTAFAFDPLHGSIEFTWFLYGTNGWNAPTGIPLTDHGTKTAAGRGWRNDLFHLIDQEVGSGQRVAVVTARNTFTGLVSTTSIPVQLIQNEAPVMDSIGIYNIASQAITEITKASLPQRTVVKFSGTATDANNDVVYFKWDLTPPGTVPPSMTLYGREAYVDVSDWPGSTEGVTYDLLGVCTAYDRFGVASTPMDLPSLIVKT